MLLHKGFILQAELSTVWREKNDYYSAINLVKNALL